EFMSGMAPFSWEPQQIHSFPHFTNLSFLVLPDASWLKAPTKLPLGITHLQVSNIVKGNDIMYGLGYQPDLCPHLTTLRLFSQADHPPFGWRRLKGVPIGPTQYTPFSISMMTLKNLRVLD